MPTRRGASQSPRSPLARGPSAGNEERGSPDVGRPDNGQRVPAGRRRYREVELPSSVALPICPKRRRVEQQGAVELDDVHRIRSPVEERDVDTGVVLRGIAVEHDESRERIARETYALSAGLVARKEIRNRRAISSRTAGGHAAERQTGDRRR
jgi:hypothetical protein